MEREGTRDVVLWSFELEEESLDDEHMVCRQLEAVRIKETQSKRVLVFVNLTASTVCKGTECFQLV